MNSSRVKKELVHFGIWFLITANIGFLSLALTQQYGDLGIILIFGFVMGYCVGKYKEMINYS